MVSQLAQLVEVGKFAWQLWRLLGLCDGLAVRTGIEGEKPGTKTPA